MFAKLRECVTARLPKGRVARGVMTLTSGTAVAQAINMCAMPIVTRLYTPAEIGIISLFLSFFSFWSSTLSLRFEYAQLIANDDAESHVVHRLAMTLVVLMSILGLPILWELRHTRVLGFGLLSSWAPLVLVPILLGYGWFLVYRCWALRAGLVRGISKATVVRSAARAGVRVLFGLIGGGVPVLFAAEFASAWGAMLRLVRDVRVHFAVSRPSRITHEELLSAAKSYMKFGVWETPSTWINQVASVLPVPIMASLFGASAAGWFGLARAIGSIPNAQVGRAVGDVLYSELAAALRAGDLGRARSLFYRAMAKLAVFGIGPIMALGALSPILAPLIFGRSWAEAGWIVAAIAPWLYVELIISPLSTVLGALQVQQYELISNLISLVTIALAYMMAKYYAWALIYTVLAITAARVVTYLCYLVIMVLTVNARMPATSGSQN